MGKKICKMVKDGQQKNDPEKFKSAVKGAKHYCKECGRVAGKSSHLCKSEKL